MLGSLSFSNNLDRSGRVFPLSLLAFIATSQCLSLSDKTGSGSGYRNENGADDQLSQVPGIHHMFRKHVNPKKQHEIKQLGKVKNEKMTLQGDMYTICTWWVYIQRGLYVQVHVIRGYMFMYCNIVGYGYVYVYVHVQYKGICTYWIQVHVLMEDICTCTCNI